jgi:hypothetical protein
MSLGRVKRRAKRTNRLMAGARVLLGQRSATTPAAVGPSIQAAVPCVKKKVKNGSKKRQRRGKTNLNEAAHRKASEVRRETHSEEKNADDGGTDDDLRATSERLGDGSKDERSQSEHGVVGEGGDLELRARNVGVVLAEASRRSSITL